MALPLAAQSVGEAALYQPMEVNVFRYGGLDFEKPLWCEINSGLFYNYNANLYMFKMGINRKICDRVRLNLNYIMASQKYALLPGTRSMEFVQLSTSIRI